MWTWIQTANQLTRSPYFKCNIFLLFLRLATVHHKLSWETNEICIHRARTCNILSRCVCLYISIAIHHLPPNLIQWESIKVFVGLICNIISSCLFLFFKFLYFVSGFFLCIATSPCSGSKVRKWWNYRFSLCSSHSFGFNEKMLHRGRRIGRVNRYMPKISTIYMRFCGNFIHIIKCSLFLLCLTEFYGWEDIKMT